MATKAKNLYTHPAVCVICEKKYMAYFAVGNRAKVCTPPTHVCPRKIKRLSNGTQKVIACTERCCRSEYAAGAAASLDNAIDPRKVLTDPEFADMWRATKALALVFRMALRFIAMTGCRLAEALVVRVRDVDIRPGKLSYVSIRTYKRKGHPPRRVFIDNLEPLKFSAELAKWVQGKLADEVLFQCPRRSLQRALERVLEPIKPDRASLIHIFRHTRASLLERMGFRPSLIQQQMGWANLDMLTKYAHSTEDEVAESFARGRSR